VCGIAGYTHRRRFAGPERITGITVGLRHRGPDQQGIFVSDAVSIGAVRLKILDLSAGGQPFLSEDGQTVLVYNGEVYNYREVREELARRGQVFHSQSDTEVVLKAFLEWDTDCFARLKGMFGLALWQERRRRLVLARDRMGIKPLYFCLRAGQIYFGSEMKALLAHPEIPRRLGRTALELYLAVNYVPGPLTLIEGIEKLPPGHFLEWNAGKTAIRPFWSLDFRPNEALGEEEAASRLDELLRRSIREHLVSDVPLGVLLSGGIDSSSILHYAAASSPRVKTFSISFPGRTFDESRYFRAVASHYGCEHHELALEPDDRLEDAIQQFAEYADEPCGDSSSLPVWRLSKLCRQHVTVALSGEGADELFGGYLTYQADRLARIARLLPASFRRAMLWSARRLPVSDDKISLEYTLKRFLEGTFLPPLEAHYYWNGGFSVRERQALCNFPVAPWSPVLPPAGGINRFLCFDQLYYLPDDILAKVDRMSMAHSLEVRPPFLDHEIVEFAATLPERFKIRGRQQKYLLRRLMRGRLPEAVLTRQKVGFDIPAHDWLRTTLKPLLRQVLNPAALARTGLFHSEAIQQLMRDHFDRRVNAGFHLWSLMILLLWMEKWQIQPPPEPAEQAASPVEAAPLETTGRLSFS
jgi:asparagine synthase (glutamine-hydrolysing)